MLSAAVRRGRLIGVFACACACGPQPAPAVSSDNSSAAVSAMPSTAPQPAVLSGTLFPVSDERVVTMGRVQAVNEGRLRFGYPGVTLRFCFRGKQLSLLGSSNNGRSRLRTRVDDVQASEVKLPATPSELLLWQAPDTETESRSHCAEIVHLTETWIGIVTLSALRIAGDLEPPPQLPTRRLLFIGDSVTCGEAVSRKESCNKDEQWWDADQSYGPLLARALNAQFQLVCYGGRGVVRDWQGKSDVLNAPQFFSLTVPEETADETWNMSHYVPDGVVISLGTNDFNLSLGDFPKRESFVKTYVGLVRDVLKQFPNAKVFLTEGAIVNNDEPKAAQKAVLRGYLQEVVKRLGTTSVQFIPANHYPGDTCDPHPTAEQHIAMASDLTPVVATALGWK